MMSPPCVRLRWLRVRIDWFLSFPHLPLLAHYVEKTGSGLVKIAQGAKLIRSQRRAASVPRSLVRRHCVVEDDIEEGSVDVPLVDLDNEAACASVKDEFSPLPGRLEWRCAPQRGDLSPAMPMIHWRVMAAWWRALGLYIDTGYG